MPAKVFRLLVVEDNPERIQTFRAWLQPYPTPIPIVWARSAGAAIGLIRRDSGYVYGGILLDHDLQLQARTENDRELSGTQVVEVLIQSVSPDVPILVHSVNHRDAPRMVARLSAHGFWVTYAPMDGLTGKSFRDWIDEARSLWDEAME